MGVLSCNRRGCDNIMCDRLSHEHGYLCNDCFDELVASGPETSIVTFMDTRPKHMCNSIEQATARFNAEFISRHADEEDERY